MSAGDFLIQLYLTVMIMINILEDTGYTPVTQTEKTSLKQAVEIV
jgi:hypothetical protein